MKKMIVSLCAAMCIMCASAQAFVTVDELKIESADLVKVSGDNYTFTVNAAATPSSGVKGGDVILTVYSDVKGLYDENVKVDGKDYFVYYMDYLKLDEAGKVSFNADINLSSETYKTGAHAMLTTPDGKKIDISDSVVWPGVAAGVDIKLNDKSITDKLTVSFDSVTKLTVEGTDKYGNILDLPADKTTWTITDKNGNTPTGLIISENKIVVGSYSSNSHLRGNTYNIKVEAEGHSDTIEVYVNGSTGGGNGSGGSSSSSSSSGSGSGNSSGTVYVPNVTVPQTPSSKPASKFQDVATDFWGYNNMVNLYNKGIAKGTNGYMYPNEKITKQEIAALIVRAKGLKASGSELNDQTVDEWAKSEVLAAIENGIVKGDENGTVNGKNSATREEAAVLLARAFGVTSDSAKADFIDANETSDWAKESVEALSGAGYLKGDENGALRPKGMITRAEFFALLDRMLG